MRRHFVGKNFSTIQSVVKNPESLTLKQMFDVTAQLVNNLSDSVLCLGKLDGHVYEKNPPVNTVHVQVGALAVKLQRRTRLQRACRPCGAFSRCRVHVFLLDHHGC